MDSTVNTEDYLQLIYFGLSTMSSLQFTKHFNFNQPSYANKSPKSHMYNGWMIHFTGEAW